MTVRLSRADALSAIVPVLSALRQKKAVDQPVIVAVVGASASGKGHLIRELQRRLNADDGRDLVSVLPLDNYYLGREARLAAAAPHFDHPSAVELSLAAEDLAKMRVGERLDIPCYDFSRGERVGKETFVAKPFVFVDGLFALRSEVKPLADYAIYIETDVHSALLRRLFRDAGPAGRTKQRSRIVLDQYFNTVLPSMREFIAPTARYADIVIESRYDGATEAARAGAIQCQSKARGYRDDETIHHLTGGQRLGAVVKQIDRFLKPKDGRLDGEMLRLRSENGALFLTYKGPFAASLPGVGVRAVTQPIELDAGAEAWFKDDYDVVAEFTKLRELFYAGDVLLARDSIQQLGNFIEVRAPQTASASRLREILKTLGLDEPYYSESYFDLWMRRHGAPSEARSAAN